MDWAGIAFGIAILYVVVFGGPKVTTRRDTLEMRLASVLDTDPRPVLAEFLRDLLLVLDGSPRDLFDEMWDRRARRLLGEIGLDVLADVRTEAALRVPGAYAQVLYERENRNDGNARRSSPGRPRSLRPGGGDSGGRR